MVDIARLTEVIEPQAVALGFELVRVKLTGTGEDRTLQIMAEDPSTGQLVVDQCMALSRAVSAALDAADEEAGEELVPGAYHLEVSSPGIDRPLTREKDFVNWAGHEAHISLTEAVGDHRKLRGRIVSLEGGVLTVADRKAGTIEVPYALVHSAKLVLTNDLIAATRPIDTTGADEVEETEDFTEGFLEDLDDTLDLEEEKADD